jgi:hypothetical protein
MKLKKYVKLVLLLNFTLFNFSCTPQPKSVDFSINQNEINMGVETNGIFTKNESKIFSKSDKILLKFKVSGLTIKQSKIKTNIDMFLKKGSEILGSQNDILGLDGVTQIIPNIDTNYSGTAGEADLQLSILPPSETTGDMATNITIKDLNSMGKILTFEAKFNIKEK